MESNKKITTISLKEATKKALEKRKIHPNQSYDEIIKALINGEDVYIEQITGELNPSKEGDASNDLNKQEVQNG